VPREQHRIPAPLGKRRDAHDDLGQAVIKVLAKPPFADHRFRFWCVAQTIRASTGIALRPADPLDHPLLQKAQQLHLQGQRNVTHFVEEQRAALRLLDLALGGLMAPVNAPFS
jgi:hypothetical protein